ncbi:MAG: hypothetical protein ACTHM1_11015 [Solirubrobacteraceae bacterium]
MRLRTSALAAAVLLALSASSALASEGSTIIEHCAKGQSLSGFSENGYREALKDMPTVGLEYSPCEQQVRRAELAAAGGGGAGSGAAGGAAGVASSVPLPLTPSEQHEVLSAQHRPPAPVLLGKTPVEPGVMHADVASAASTLPTSLLTVLALLLGGAALFVLGETLKRVRARRHR